jgi:hypothetical protein
MIKKRAVQICFILLPVFFLSSRACPTSCPASKQINKIEISHTITIIQDSPYGPYMQLSDVDGETEISVENGGYVIPTGNKSGYIKRKIKYTTSICSCESATYQADAAIMASGACSNGKLSLNVLESYEGGNIPVTCHCSTKPYEFTYNQPILHTSNTFKLEISYKDGAKVTQKPSCTGCLGTYSWTLRFSPMDDGPALVPLISWILPLLLSQ